VPPFRVLGAEPVAADALLGARSGGPRLQRQRARTCEQPVRLDDVTVLECDARDSPQLGCYAHGRERGAAAVGGARVGAGQIAVSHPRLLGPGEGALGRGPR
jgi:hypothetical protein